MLGIWGGQLIVKFNSWTASNCDNQGAGKLKMNKVCSVNPLLSPPGGFISSPFEGGFIATGGLLNLETTMVSVLLKELEYKVEKLKYEKL